MAAVVRGTVGSPEADRPGGELATSGGGSSSSGERRRSAAAAEAVALSR